MGDDGAAEGGPPAVPTQPNGPLPLPPSPPPDPAPRRPEDAESLAFPQDGNIRVGVVPNVPNENLESTPVATAPVEQQRRHSNHEGEEMALEEGDRAPGASPPWQGFNLSGELVPVTVSGEKLENNTPNYYDWEELFPELRSLVEGVSKVAAECKKVSGWKAWPEKHYDEGRSQDWKVFPFVHTFPANDESRRTWIESTCGSCPATCALLRRVPNIRTALFSRLGAGSRISGHRGWADLANHVLRCHLPLEVPSDGPCGLWVDEEVRLHAEGKIIVFDDSKLHKAFNESSGDRMVLIVDILRPPGIPLGTADGEHTPELDGFIDAFR